jgi:DNA modification methylase
MPSANASVVLGDAFDLLKTVASGTVDLLLTSPPYWGHRCYHGRHNWDIWNEWIRGQGDRSTTPSYEWYRSHGGILGLEPHPDWYVQHLVEILGEAKHCLKPEGSMWINLGDTYFARWASIRENGRQGFAERGRQRRRTPMGDYRQEKQLLLIPARFAIAMQQLRWILRNDLIWHKPNVPPRPETDRLRLTHEHFFHFVKRPTEGRAKYYYRLSHVEPGAMDVVTHNMRPGKDGHTATFPEEVIRPRILSSCPPGGLVCDPFCGTGRALTVALSCGRNTLGFDISPAFVRSARRSLMLTEGMSDDGKDAT